MLIALDVVEDKDEPIASGQIGDCALESEAVDGACQVQIRAPKTASGTFLGSRVHGFIERNERQALSSEVHQDDIDSEPMHPGGERRIAAESGNFPVQLQKRFLGEVLGFGGVAHHAEAEGIDPPLVQGVKLCEGVMIAILGSSEDIVLSGD